MGCTQVRIVFNQDTIYTACLGLATVHTSLSKGPWLEICPLPSPPISGLCWDGSSRPVINCSVLPSLSGQVPSAMLAHTPHTPRECKRLPRPCQPLPYHLYPFQTKSADLTPVPSGAAEASLYASPLAVCDMGEIQPACFQQQEV